MTAADHSTAPLLAAARELHEALRPLRFAAPVDCVYDPLDYAWDGHASYLQRYGAGPKRVLFLGMNPGPFGMSQTGIPFGVPALVRSFLHLEPRIGRPALQHPKRPILGMDCPRHEVSGTRLWGAVQSHFGTPERFFADHLVVSYCPLAFVEASGRNRTPDKLPAAERSPLYAACDRHLARLLDALAPRWVVGIGQFAHDRARAVLGGRSIRLAQILHPSPANPRAASNWAQQVRQQLHEQGVCP